jgi:hypothetical protein
MVDRQGTNQLKILYEIEKNSRSASQDKQRQEDSFLPEFTGLKHISLLFVFSILL